LGSDIEDGQHKSDLLFTVSSLLITLILFMVSFALPERFFPEFPVYALTAI
jgi:hypothetical protein